MENLNLKDQIMNIIINLLNESDDYHYIFDKNQQYYGDRRSSFQTRVKYLVEENFDQKISDECVSKIWKHMRDRFVKLNKKMAGKENLTEKEIQFYKKLIFLEPHIEHKGGIRVAKLPPSSAEDSSDGEGRMNMLEAVGVKFYSLMYPDKDYDNILDEFPDAKSLFEGDNGNNEVNEVEFLDEDKDAVASYVQLTQKNCKDIVKSTTDQKAQLPLSTFEKNSKDCFESKNNKTVQQASQVNKQQTVQQYANHRIKLLIIEVLNDAINDQKNFTYQCLALSRILKALKSFSMLVK